MKEIKDYNPSKDPRLIDCKTECGNGKCYAKRYGLFAEKTCPNFVEPKSISNADRIRAMTDEELAAKIEELCQYAFMQISVYSKPMGKAEWLAWLKQEANE